MDSLTSDDNNKEIIKSAAAAVGSLSEVEFDVRFNPDVFQPHVKLADEEVGATEIYFLLTLTQIYYHENRTKLRPRIVNYGRGWPQATYCKMPLIRVPEIFVLFTSSKKTQKMRSELSVSERLTRKLQACELPGWTMPRIIGVLQYFGTNMRDCSTPKIHSYPCDSLSFVSILKNLSYRKRDTGLRVFIWGETIIRVSPSTRGSDFVSSLWITCSMVMLLTVILKRVYIVTCDFRHGVVFVAVVWF